MNGCSCSVRHAVSRWRNAVHPHSPASPRCTGSFREAEKPAEQQVVVDLFHPLAFAPKGVERHQQLGTRELLRRNGVTARVGVDGIEVCIEFAQCRIDHGANRAQWRVLNQHPASVSGTTPLAGLESCSAFFLHGTRYVVLYLRTGLIIRDSLTTCATCSQSATGCLRIVARSHYTCIISLSPYLQQHIHSQMIFIVVILGPADKFGNNQEYSIGDLTPLKISMRLRNGE